MKRTLPIVLTFVFAALGTVAAVTLLHAQLGPSPGGNAPPGGGPGPTLAEHEQKGREWLHRVWVYELSAQGGSIMGLDAFGRTPWYRSGTTTPAFEYARVVTPPPADFNGFIFTYEVPIDESGRVTFTLRREKMSSPYLPTPAYQWNQHDWKLSPEPGQYPFRVDWLAGPRAGQRAYTESFAAAVAMTRAGAK